VGGETPNLCGGDEVKNLSWSKNVAFFFLFGMILFWASSKNLKTTNLKKTWTH